VMATEIDFQKPGINIQEHIERTEFAHIIEYMLDQMLASIVEAEREAGVDPGDIDLVLTTGGTSLIPAVRQMLIDRFGVDKLHQRDTFTSVAAGLAVVAQHA